MTWRFDPHLPTASTLPASYYCEPSVFVDENRKLFARTWQLAGRAGQAAERGSFFTTTLAGEPVLIVRGDDGGLRALSNVCRHRAGPVARGEGTRSSFQCGYHGWTYALDGSLRTMPEMEGVECFDRLRFALPSFRVEEWNDLLFVNLDPAAPPLRDFLGDLASASFAGMRLAARKEWVVRCNWKVYVDNYLEGYHLPIAHPQLFRELDYDAYRVEEFRYYSKQHAPIRELKPGEELGRDRRYLRLPGQEESALYYWLFPNTMFNIYQDNMSSNVIVPLGVDRTLTIFEWFFAEPGSGPGWESMQQTIAFSDEIQQEDIVICEQVQRGLRSRSYDAGRFSAARENGVYHFQNLVREFLGE